MNIYDLISRAQKLRKETQLDSVSPDRVGGLHEDTLKYINEFQLLASSPSLHKAYASVSAMQSDKSPKSDLTGKPLKPGQLVVIVPASQTDATAGDVYRYDGPSGNTSAWTFVAKIGAVPADAELSATSTNPPQNKVVTEKLTELESEVNSLLIDEQHIVRNTEKKYPVILKKGYNYLFTIDVPKDATQLAIFNLESDKLIVTLGISSTGYKTRFSICPDNDIKGIRTYCNGDIDNLRLENLDLSNEGLHNKIQGLTKKYIVDSFAEAKKTTIFYTNIEKDVVYKVYAKVAEGESTQYNVYSVDVNGNDLERLIPLATSNKEYSFVPTQNAYGVRVYVSDVDIERLTISNPLSSVLFNRDIEDNKNAIDIIEGNLNNNVLTYERNVIKGNVFFGNSISADLFRVGQSVKYKLECDTFTDADGVEKPIVGGFSFGTNNGHYFDYRFNEKPNEWHTHEITEEMFNGVLTPNGIVDTNLFRIYTPSEKVLADGAVTLYYVIDLSESIEGRVEILENKGVGSVSNVPSVSDSLFEDKYQESLLITKEVPQYEEGVMDALIEIDSQSKFDKVESLINEQIGLGKKNICIYLNAEELYFSERHFDLTEENYPYADNVHLSIQGNGSVKIKAGGVTYSLHKNNIQNGKYVIANQNGGYQPKGMFLVGDQELETASEMKYAASIAEVVESHLSDDKEIVDIARIKVEDFATNPSYILLTASYQSQIYKVIKSENGYVYFNAQPILYWRPDMTIDAINADYEYGGLNPRYILFNTSKSPINVNDESIQIDLRYKSVHRCLNQTFVHVNNCFKSITISGLHFIGNMDKGIHDYNPEVRGDSLIQIDEFSNSFVKIKDNRFDYIRSEICAVGAVEANMVVASNIIFDRNEAYHCYRGLISASQYTDSIYAINNKAKDMGRAMYYEGVFNIVGSNFLIANNEVEDFTYAAIRSGIEYPREGWSGSEGIIEDNIVGWSEQYAAENWKHGKMDAGAIYTYCRHTRLIVRNNLVYNYKGIRVSRGIYIDGYAENVSVYSNMVIDSGADFGIILYKPSENDGKKATNNLCVYNVITNRYKFTGYSNCYKGLNYVILPYNNMIPNNEFDVPNIENDYNLYNSQTIFRGVRIPFQYVQQVLKFKIPNKFKSLFFSDKYL